MTRRFTCCEIVFQFHLFCLSLCLSVSVSVSLVASASHLSDHRDPTQAISVSTFLSIHNLGSMYLLAYNTVAAVLWFVVFATTVSNFVSGSYLESSTSPHQFLIAIQSVNAALEISHTIFGLVRSPLPSLLLQFFARLLITIAVSYTVPHSPGNFCLAYVGLSFAWSVTEIIRYSFFAYKEVRAPPHWLLWLRYLSFVVMYPLGLICEPMVVYKTLAYVSGFHLHFLSFGMTLYIPGFVVLYRHMWKQRRRYLS